jgi:hypothetical protein
MLYETEQCKLIRLEPETTDVDELRVLLKIRPVILTRIISVVF